MLIRSADSAIVEGYKASVLRFTESSITVLADRKKGIAGTGTIGGRGGGGGGGGHPDEIIGDSNPVLSLPWLPYMEFERDVHPEPLF